MGNAAVIEAGGTRLLVDAGFSARQLCLRLARAGVEPESLDGVILTHEHGDHVKGLRVFLRKFEVPVWATVQTAEVVRGVGQVGGRWKSFESGQRFELGSLEVESFPVMHDAVDPVGFVFRHGGAAVGYVSDVGHVPALLVERLRGLQALFVEANYDAPMLEADTKRPWPLKQRISSRHGHFSNEQAAELVAQIAHDGLQRVVLGHLSRDCNEPDVAVAAVQAKLEADGWPRTRVECACQDLPSGWLQLDAAPAAGGVVQGELF
jgi:phosphoribosyl 1,2-cyclic phosphodiesterase